LNGPLTATASHGLATFSGLSLAKAGNGYALQVTAAGLSAATTNAFNVVPAAASQLVITVPPPGSVAAGAGFNLSVAAEDALGNVTTSFSPTLTVALANDPGGATLGGP